ncbi:energy-coupling factor ABC transporter permease [Thioalkalivibrio sp. XN279]|uniref:energy-coupling factor ABC transporter permease n=1 Tax=Thioalkalivibrio sp. XN279 TaxID=2714953 RepID=UPI00140A0DD5|nr:energy-coupling factor ABC transporter permease [Thioalkalivibrio sp. XN279]NHA15587.1 cobalamin biosynthesis protein CbiM [Thioalkalivibrio sp. XN279]
MHIPDGLISPQTYLPALALAAPLWVVAARRLRARMGDEMLPRLAVFTALAFLLSTLMLPLPGGTSGHIVGVGLLALVFGPWIASLAYTLVLVLQAVVVGAGGITSLPVNALALGFVAAWTTWAGYRLLRGRNETAAVAIATWSGVMVAALLLALVLGLQPSIAQGPDGAPLFFPFGPAVTLPALLVPHAFIAAGEAALTVLVLRHAHKRRWVEAAT